MRVHETWCKPNQCCCMLSSTNKRNIDFSWTQRSVVSKPLFEKVFFQDKCFFQNCLRQFCLKGKYCFQTSAWGSGFEKEVLFPNLCLEHFFWRNVCFQTSAWGSFFPREMLFTKICLEQFCLKGKCCFQSSAWGSVFAKEVLFPNFCLGQCFWKESAISKPVLGAVFSKRSVFSKALFRTVLFEREMLFPNLCLGQWFWRKNVVSKPLLGTVFLKRNAVFKLLFGTICLQNSAVSKLFLGAVFFPREVLFPNLFQTVLFEREVLFPDLCLGAVVLKKKCCLQTSAWGSLFQGNCCLRTSAWGSLFKTVLFDREVLFPDLCLGLFFSRQVYQYFCVNRKLAWPPAHETFVQHRTAHGSKKIGWPEVQPERIPPQTPLVSSAMLWPRAAALALNWPPSNMSEFQRGVQMSSMHRNQLVPGVDYSIDLGPLVSEPKAPFNRPPETLLGHGVNFQQYLMGLPFIAQPSWTSWSSFYQRLLQGPAVATSWEMCVCKISFNVHTRHVHIAAWTWWLSNSGRKRIVVVWGSATLISVMSFDFIFFGLHNVERRNRISPYVYYIYKGLYNVMNVRIYVRFVCSLSIHWTTTWSCHLLYTGTLHANCSLV